ncbi:PH domain-containing protein [Providencia rettgeri]|nr:PH domain-containing protein [Providencia rettgeri]
MINYKTASKDDLLKEYKRLSDVVGDTPVGTKKEFLHLPQILHSNEIPQAIASGSMENKNWLLVLTNYRVIFLNKGMLFGLKQMDINLDNIVSVGGKTGMLLGDILIGTSGQNYTISNVSKKTVVPFTNLVNEARDKKKSINAEPQPTNSENLSNTSTDDLIAQLEKLASLKEKGVLSEEEFLQQKNKLLNS